MRHNYIGTEYLLLGLLRENDGVAATVLKKLGLNLEQARTQVMEYLGPETELKRVTRGEISHLTDQPPTGGFSAQRQITTRFESTFNVTLEAQSIIECADGLALLHKQDKIDTGHLMLALLNTGEWSELLSSAGLDINAARAMVEKHLKSEES